MKYKKRQSGKGLLTAALPIARAILPFIGRSATSGAIGLGASSLLGKIIGGKRRKRNRKRFYRRYAR